MIFSTELGAFMSDMLELWKEDVVDFYLVGLRFGIFWKLLFDINLE